MPDEGLLESGQALAVPLWKEAICDLTGGDLAVGVGWLVRVVQRWVSLHLASRAVAELLDRVWPRAMGAIFLTELYLPG